MGTFFNILAILCFIFGTGCADGEPFEVAFPMAVLLIGLSFLFGWIGNKLESRSPKQWED